jgi:hypothetical protein
MNDPVCSYRLSIHPSLELFRPELEFACAFLDQCHFVSRADHADIVLHYGPEAPDGAVAVPSVLFPDCVLVDGGGIFPIAAALENAAAGQPGLLPAGDGDDFDALGLVFLMLSRLEERGSSAVDKYGRFPIFASFPFNQSSLTTPICDIAVQRLAGKIRGEPAPKPRSTHRIWLTHDYDTLRGFHRPFEPLRYALGDIVKRHQPSNAGRRLQRTYFSGEPQRSLSFILDMTERLNAVSHFFFMGRSDHSMDSPYLLRDAALARKVADEIIDRGHVVGFHPGFETCRDAAVWQRQKSDVEEVLGRDVTIGRQHVLMFDAEATWDIWDDGGMAIDMTLGYPEQSGFRTGTCRRHPTYSLRRRRRLDLMEYPSAIMDFGFFGGRYRDLSVDAALEECRGIIETSRHWGGDLVVLYHPGQYHDATVRDWYSGLMEIV